MKTINLKDNDAFLEEYIRLCSLEWGTLKSDDEMKSYIIDKRKRIHNEDKVISILGLIDNNKLVGFISLFKYDGVDLCQVLGHNFLHIFKVRI